MAKQRSNSEATDTTDWDGERLRDDKCWQYDVPPTGNANFAWVHHIVHRRAPSGVAGFVLANGPMSSNQFDEGEIHRNLIKADLNCMVALPSQPFHSTQISVRSWIDDSSTYLIHSEIWKN